MPNRKKEHQVGLWGRMRGYFLAGLLVVAPVGITFWLSWLVLSFIDARVTPLVPEAYNPNTYVPFGIPGLGVLILILFITFVGALTRVLLGRWMVRGGEHLLSRMPVVRSIYGATKQIVETVLANQSDAFRQAVLFEYPRRGSWAIGFVTGKTIGEVQNMTADDVVNVFLPTTPNPTSGYLLFLPRRELVELSMSVEDAIKMIISGGIVTPPDTRPVAQQQVPLVAAADGDVPTIGDDKPSVRTIEKETEDAD
ncbi:MAG: DUF502 domain-containing protein [Alphaproteobacteria bacterium]|nr:DUF502 domain-containing protein [Alphaproteobacteria bacterium]